MGRVKIKTKEDFFTKVDVQKSGCWFFCGYIDRWGYGIACYNSRPMGAHRLSWFLHNGDIPNGLFVLHKCDIPKCVNPDHLFLGTPQDNMDDMVRKGRSRRMSHCVKGHLLKRSKKGKSWCPTCNIVWCKKRKQMKNKLSAAQLRCVDALKQPKAYLKPPIDRPGDRTGYVTTGGLQGYICQCTLSTFIVLESKGVIVKDFDGGYYRLSEQL